MADVCAAGAGGNLGEARAAARVRSEEGTLDLVHGHSSHHPRPIEIYRDKLVLYGCGDFVTDYEGIGGYEEFRSDLCPAYLARLETSAGKLEELRIAVPAGPVEASEGLERGLPVVERRTLRASRIFGTRVVPSKKGSLVVQARQ